MMFLELDWAIFKRLTGYPLDNHGKPLLDASGVPKNRERIGPPNMNDSDREWDEVKQVWIPRLPLLPSYGVRIPTLKPAHRGQQGLSTLDPGALPLFAGFEPNSFKQIPVFDQNLSGRKYDDAWPSVTFRWIGTDFDPSPYIYSDDFGGQDTSSVPVTIDGEDGYSMNYSRPHPESWPSDYVIAVHAKNDIELKLICDAIIRLFPARGALNVEFASGEVHACDMTLLRVENLDEGGIEGATMTLGHEEQRGLHRSFVYRIEGYVDNTVNKFGVNDTRKHQAIVERIFEFERIYLCKLEQTEEDQVVTPAEVNLTGWWRAYQYPWIGSASTGPSGGRTLSG